MSLVRIKDLSILGRGASPRPIEDPKYFDANGKYSWVRIADVTEQNGKIGKTPTSLSKLGADLSVKLEPGRLFLSIAGSVGKPCINSVPVCIHDGFVYLKENNPNLNDKWLFYIFEGKKVFDGLGKIGTQLNLNIETVGNIKVPNLSLKKQNEIVEFLDNKTKDIDLALSKLKQKLLHLEEYKTALIHNAVTKGLDANGCRILDGTPADQMKWKDSGVEWIGEIPDGWGVEKVKSITSNYDGMRIPLSAENRVEGEYPYHGANSVQGYVKDYIFDGDYVLVGEDGAPFFELGKNVSRVVSGKFWVNNHAHIIKPLDGYPIKFINEALNSVDYRDYISGSTRDKLTKGQLSSIVLPYPSIKEAEVIDSYLFNKDAVIELAKQAINKKIALLLEYKKSLINEAVSGEMLY